MNTTLKVMKYAFFDLLRSRWLIAYTLFFAAATSGLLYFGDEPSQAALSSLNVVLLVVPLVAADGTLIGVFDIDSPEYGRFDVEDQHGLEAIAQAYVESLE